MIDVLVADDQAMVRDGFAAILGVEDDVASSVTAADGVEAVEAAVRLAPDVVVMDVRMPRMDGIEATRQVVARTAAKVLILTTFDLDEYVFRAVDRAARRASSSRTRLAVVSSRRSARSHRGDMLVDQAVTRRLVERFARAQTSGEHELEQLTAREREVFASWPAASATSRSAPRSSSARPRSRPT